MNIKPFKLGIGNFHGKIALNTNDDWNKGKHCIKMQFKKESKINISVIKLDAFKVFFNCKNLIVKIDVEGSEKEVVDGTKLLFIQAKNVIVMTEIFTEINNHLICIEIVETFRKLDFNKVYKINCHNKLIAVQNFEGSVDYAFIKVINALQNLSNSNY